MWALFSESTSMAGQSRFWEWKETSKSLMIVITASTEESPSWSSCEGSSIV